MPVLAVPTIIGPLVRTGNLQQTLLICSSRFPHGSDNGPIINNGEVIFIGENYFIRFSRDGSETMSERISQRRAFWTPPRYGQRLGWR
jgi:hypothetical protein